MTTRRIFTTAAIVSMCGLVSACAAAGDDADVVDVSMDGRGVELQKVSKVDAITIKQTTFREDPSDDTEDRIDDRATTEEAKPTVVYGPVITIKPKG
jgi:hypothetical protein